MSFGPYCYFNNGMSFRAVDPAYQPQAGEVLFQNAPSADDLIAAFPGYSAANAVQQAIFASQAAILAGANVISTGTPAINGVYSLSPSALANINAAITSILLNGTFPNGETTMAWVDSDGEAHVFPDVQTFKNFATAVSAYAAQVLTYGDTGGAHGSLPTQTLNIP